MTNKEIIFKNKTIYKDIQKIKGSAKFENKEHFNCRSI